MWLLYIMAVTITVLFSLIFILWTVKKMKAPKTESSPSGKGWSDYIPTTGLPKILVTVVVYLFLLYCVRELLPHMWWWLWEKEVFWIIQGAVACTALIFWLGPVWSRYILLPAIGLVLIGFLAVESENDDRHRMLNKEREDVYVSPPTEAEIRGFLTNPAPPSDLATKKDRGEIWDLEILFSGVVTREEWSRVVEIPTPPRGRHYRFRTEVLKGQIEVMNRGEYQGRHPHPRLRIMSHRPLRLQYRSAELPQNAVVVWRWTQGRY